MTKTIPDMPLENLQRIHRLWQMANAVFGKHLQDFDGLTERRFAVLAVLSREKDITQNNLVGRTGIDRSTVSALVTQLVRLGLVTRAVCDADARAYSLNITAKGARLMAQAMPAAMAADKEISGLLPLEVWQLLGASIEQGSERANG